MIGQRKTVRISRKLFKIIWSPLFSISFIYYVQYNHEIDQFSTQFYTAFYSSSSIHHSHKFRPFCLFFKITFVFVFLTNQIIESSYELSQSKCNAGKLRVLIGWANLREERATKCDRFRIYIYHHHPPEKGVLRKISLETGNF